MRKIPLRVWFIGIVGVAALVIASLMIYRLLVNHSFVRAYANENYDTTGEEKLLNFNFPESYVPYYNLGNAAYKRGDYTSAITHYNDALKNFPSEKRDCLIRINLALSMCNTIDFYSLDTQDKVDTALFILYKARDVLLENGCASNDGKGHNADAQQLKEDIDRMIEQLKNPEQNQNNEQQQSGNDSSDSNDESSGDDHTPSDKEKKAKKELEEKRKGALEDRKEQQGNLEQWSDYVGGQGEDGDEAEGGSQMDVSPW